MITEEKYQDTKKIFLDCIKIMKQYNLQPKDKKINGRPKIRFTIDEKINKINNVFYFNSFYNYSQIIEEIKTNFKLGSINSKKLLTELQREKLISKTGPRGKYEKCF